MMKLFKVSTGKETNEISLDMEKIPKHIAIIMDGNGRWAKARFLPRTMGHKAGVETIRRVMKECSNLGVKYLTLYAFSTENWKRPENEVSALMKLLVEYLKTEVKELNKNNVSIRAIGDVSRLPKECRDEIERAEKLTKNNTGLIASVALNYGGRDEITRTVKDIAKMVKACEIEVEDIDEDFINIRLDTKGIPDPDLIIRPSGEKRISNFLLWQCAYSEFWYSNINWPDFKEEDLRMAIYDYQNRDRRYGGV